MNTQSEALDKLAPALAAAQATMADAIKDSVNPHFDSRYADLASVREAVSGPLAAHGLAVIQTVVPRDPVAAGVPNCLGALRTMLVHSSGQWVAGEQPIAGDWANPQKIGSAITYARRYGLAAICGIAQDDDDANVASPPPRQQRHPQPDRRQAPPPSRDFRRPAQAPPSAPADVDDWDPPSDRSEPIPPRDEMPLKVPPGTGPELLRFARAMKDVDWFKAKIKAWKYGDRFSTLSYAQVTKLFQEWNLKQRRNGSAAPAAAANGQPMTNGALH